MAHSEQPSNYSPTNSVFYNNSYSSPESPTSNNSRKRKQEQQQQEFQQYDEQSQANNGVLDSLYQSYNQPWNSSSQNNGQQDFIIPITSSSSTTTAATYHQHEDPSLTWHRTTNSDDSFMVSTTYQPDSFMNHSSQKTNGGVGENTEIHHLLNLDQPSAFQFINTKENTRALHLDDLGNQRLIHQAWSPQQQQNYNGANSPGFFTPGFLESLQEDENESPESFPFHVVPPTGHWNTLEDIKSNIEPDSILVKKKKKIYCLLYFPTKHYHVDIRKKLGVTRK